ncbi:MAG TPA: PaaI family thioesterase [Terracidiphilus sp.]|jgi:uncharacterized protein (TIGR00369 family)|nr:PaaI family thioesterase [Terracidiphilus sp.]
MTKIGSNEKLTPFASAAQNRCFGCGRANDGGLHLEFFLTEDLQVVCMTKVGDAFEGPKGYVHGGIIATLLDETMSKAVRAHGLVAMTRHMEVDYQRPVPSTEEIRLEGRVTRNEGRKHWTEAAILNGEGKVLAHGKGLFIEVRPAADPDPVKDGPTPHG